MDDLTTTIETSPEALVASIETPAVIDPPTIGPLKEPTPFTVNAFLALLKTLPDTVVRVEEPFAPGGTWTITINTTMKWLDVAFNPTRKDIYVEHMMDYNPAGGLWNMLHNSAVKFTTVDDAMTSIQKTLA